MKRLFEPGFVYPSDREGGRYVELSGPIVTIGSFDAGGTELREIELTVKTAEYGERSGWWRTPRSSTFQAELGMWATVRVYDAGGGWYPDDRVTHIWRVPVLAPIRVLWRHPYNGWLYGIPYPMRYGQSPTDIWRAPARREIAWTPKLGSHERWVDEVVPPDWLVLDEREPNTKAWLEKIENDDGPGVPKNPYEWSAIQATEVPCATSTT